MTSPVSEIIVSNDAKQESSLSTVEENDRALTPEIKTEAAENEQSSHSQEKKSFKRKYGLVTNYAE